MLGDLIIPVDSLSINLGMGLSITLKAGVEQLRLLLGVVAQRSEHLWLKQGPEFDSQRLPWVFLLQLAY